MRRRNMYRIESTPGRGQAIYETEQNQGKRNSIVKTQPTVEEIEEWKKKVEAWKPLSEEAIEDISKKMFEFLNRPRAEQNSIGKTQPTVEESAPPDRIPFTKKDGSVIFISRKQYAYLTSGKVGRRKNK